MTSKLQQSLMAHGASYLEAMAMTGDAYLDLVKEVFDAKQAKEYLAMKCKVCNKGQYHFRDKNGLWWCVGCRQRRFECE